MAWLAPLMELKKQMSFLCDGRMDVGLHPWNSHFLPHENVAIYDGKSTTCGNS
jgi:hypothetical protein